MCYYPSTFPLLFQAQANNTNIEPGSSISVPFTVTTTTNGVVNDSATGTFTVRANNDRSYTSTSPNTVTIAAGSGGKANGTITLTVPASAASGTDVTLTIEAENAAATDINYTVLRFSVIAKVRENIISLSCGIKESRICWWFGENLESDTSVVASSTGFTVYLIYCQIIYND